MPKGGFGNLIALPLQRIPAQNKNSLFVNTNFEYYKDQWKYLSSIRKISLDEVITTIDALEKELKYNSITQDTNISLKNIANLFFGNGCIQSIKLTSSYYSGFKQVNMTE